MEDTSLFVSKFHVYKRPLVLDFEVLESLLQTYVKNHFVTQAVQRSELKGIKAHEVDIEK